MSPAGRDMKSGGMETPPLMLVLFDGIHRHSCHLSIQKAVHGVLNLPDILIKWVELTLKKGYRPRAFRMVTVKIFKIGSRLTCDATHMSIYNRHLGLYATLKKLLWSHRVVHHAAAVSRLAMLVYRAC